jgi:hypothetical protein
VNRFRNNFQDTRGLPYAAQVIHDVAYVGSLVGWKFAVSVANSGEWNGFTIRVFLPPT